MSVYLNRMKNATLFTLRVWKSDGRWEIAVACDSAVTTHPVVIPLPCVHHGPRQECVGLPVHRVTLWATITSHATTDTLAILKVFKLVREGAVGKPVKMKQNIFHPYFLSEARPHLQLGYDRAREGSNAQSYIFMILWWRYAYTCTRCWADRANQNLVVEEYLRFLLERD